MLIIPLTEKTTWQNPPFITIALILINCFVFFFIQTNEHTHYDQAAEYYVQSGLARIEGERYAQFLAHENRTEDLSAFTKNRKKFPEGYLLSAIEGDGAFIKKLHNDEIITPHEQIYTKWKDSRRLLADKLSKIIYLNYGHRPAYFSLKTCFTYMFLHGSLMHLVGNMIFLWLVGSILELSCHRLSYILGYLATGIFSCFFFSVIYHDSTVPLVGASGAIAGLMGAFTVIFGKGRVKIFYSLGFYFNYARIRAIALLPFWLGNELFQLFFGGPSNVAFVGHIGGLISGALLGFIHLKVQGPVEEEKFAEERTHEISSLMEKGIRQLGDLNYEDARQSMLEILRIEPSNLEVRKHLFTIYKNKPQSEEFQNNAADLLTRLSQEKDSYDILLKTYSEYSRLSTPLLPKELYSRLGILFADHGNIKEAVTIITFLIKQSVDYPKMPNCLLSLAKAYLKKNLSDRAQKCLQVLQKKYPESLETKILNDLLRRA